MLWGPLFYFLKNIAQQLNITILYSPFHNSDFFAESEKPKTKMKSTWKRHNAKKNLDTSFLGVFTFGSLEKVVDIGNSK